MKYQAKLLIYRKMASFNPLSDFEGELRPNQIIQVLEQFCHWPLRIINLKLKVANQSSQKAP